DDAVDLVERHLVAGAGIGGERARAEADDGDAQRGRVGVQRLEDPGHRALPVVVGDGLAAARGVERLPAVERRAVAQLAVSLFVPVTRDAQDAHEPAGPMY